MPRGGADAYEGLLVRSRGDQEGIRERGGVVVAEPVDLHSDP